MKTEQKILAIGGALLILIAPCAFAELTATVRPAIQFSAGDRPTVAQLNLLGTPTVLISGTLGGTNVALGAGTVSGTMLMDSVAGSNLIWNANSPRGLVIADSGVNVSQVASNLAGLGLGGGAGAPLSNKVDGVRIIIANDTVTFVVPTNTLVGGGTNNLLAISPEFVISSGTLSNKTFISSEYSIPNTDGGGVTNVAHNIGLTPSFVRWVLVCKTNNANYEPGDEVPIERFYDAGGSIPSMLGGANSTNVFLTFNRRSGVPNKTGSGYTAPITESNWKAKCYARP